MCTATAKPKLHSQIRNLYIIVDHVDPTPMPPTALSPKKLTPLIVLLLPLLLLSHYPLRRIPPFTPRQIIYSKSYLPFLLAPWGWPASHGALFSRFLQCISIIWNNGSGKNGFGVEGWYQLYGLWILIGWGRVLTGFLLTRSVGWAYPWLFHHYALYEVSAGVGPALVAYAFLIGAGGRGGMRECGRFLLWDRDWGVVGLCVVLSWLEGAPWTYATAIICAFLLALGRDLVSSRPRSPYHPMDLSPDPNPTPSYILKPKLKLKNRILTTTLTILLLPLPSLISALFPTNTPRN